MGIKWCCVHWSYLPPSGSCSFFAIGRSRFNSLFSGVFVLNKCPNQTTTAAAGTSVYSRSMFVESLRIRKSCFYVDTHYVTQYTTSTKSYCWYLYNTTCTPAIIFKQQQPHDINNAIFDVCLPEEWIWILIINRCADNGTSNKFV